MTQQAGEPGPGRLAQKAATRRRLLDAAVAEFVERSVAATSVDVVAAAAGVSKATLFFHFGSRNDLLEAVATDMTLRAAKPVWHQERPGLRPFVSSYLAAQRRPEARMVWEITDLLQASGRPLPDEGYRRIIEHVAERLREDGHDPDRLDALAGIVTAALLYLGRRIAFGQAGSDEVARFRADLDGVLTPHRSGAGVL